MKKIIFFTIIVLLIISACCKSNKYIIPISEQFKMEFLDTIIFKSNNEIQDTLYINRKKEEISPDFYDNDNCRDNNWYQHFYFTYNIIKNGIEKNAYFYIRQSLTNGTSIKHNIPCKFIKEHKKYTLNKIEYENVQEYSCDNDIIKVYANPQYGIISYQKETGEIFYIHKYIKVK